MASSLFSRKPLLSSDSSERVVACIREVEKRTSGEIRVCIESHCKYVDAVERAMELFAQLGMDQTTLRNGVLLYLALKDHQFAIYGDQGIHQVGGDELWQHAAATLRQYLSGGDVEKALCSAIEEIGEALVQHFPPDPFSSRNELPDEIIFGQ